MQAWVIGNWKQNPATSREVTALVDTVLTSINESDDLAARSGCQLMVAPSCIHLAAVSERLKGSKVLSAAQDISAHSETTGAYTGDCSAQQVRDAGATWSLLGHSERRQYHQENNDNLLQKLTCAFNQNLGVVLCIGETQAQYDNGQTFSVLEAQLTVIKELLAKSAVPPANLVARLIIAYEPVWAIGTGKVPTVAEVEATHAHIKQTLAGFDNQLADTCVVYGGSVNANNADSFAASPMIDGALVGGASLKADSFLTIAQAFSRAKSEK